MDTDLTFMRCSEGSPWGSIAGVTSGVLNGKRWIMLSLGGIVGMFGDEIVAADEGKAGGREGTGAGEGLAVVD